MANDAIILSLDTLKFRWTAARTMRAYLIGVAADNLGTVQVTEALTSTRIKHRPNLGRPFSWPLGFDGQIIYQRTGGLPDIVRYSLVVVRDRFAVRRAGEILSKIANNAEFKRIVAAAQGLAAGTAAAGVALGVLAPIMNVIGTVLEDVNDRVLDTIDGGMHFDVQDKKKAEHSDTVRSSIADAEFDFHLFDADIDRESAAHIKGSMDSLKESGLLIGS